MIEKLKKESFTAPLLVLAVALLSVLVGSIPVMDAIQSKEELFLTSVILELLIFVLPGVFYAKCKKRGYTSQLQLISFGFSKLPLVVLMSLVMAMGAILMSLIYTHFGLSFDSSTSFLQEAVALSGEAYFESEKDVVYLALVLAVVPAFAEEFFFRGILLKEYSRYGMFPSILVCALFFAMLHFDLTLFPVYFLAGMALGYTAYATRSAFAAGAVHAIFNLFSLFVSPLVSNFISLESGKIAVFYVVTVLFLLLLMLAFGEGERLFAGYSVSGISSPRRVQKRFAALPPSFEMLSPTFLICVLLFVLVALKILPV
ncbi:MAG: CPBP family intramembrane metalloprotease [Clostridia bacterium]|nr:CPBP family intramembrane metalloprotease [Clostridia bacterium]